MARALAVDVFGVRFLFRWQVWATMRSRITFVARVALYATIVVVLMANRHAWEAQRIWAHGVEIDALARTDVPDAANLPVRVVTSRVGAGEVAARLRWRTSDGNGHALGAGEVDSPGCVTLQLPDRARLGGVAITAFADSGEQDLWLPLPGPREARLTVEYVADGRSLAIRAVDRNGTPLRGEVRAAVVEEGADLSPWDRRSSARTDHAGIVSQLIGTRRLDLEVTLLTARLGLLGLSFWIAGELGAFCARRLVRRGRGVMWQFVGAALVVVGLYWQWPLQPPFDGHGRPPRRCPLDLDLLYQTLQSLDRIAPHRDMPCTSDLGEARIDLDCAPATRCRARVDFRSPTHAGSTELTFAVR